MKRTYHGTCHCKRVRIEVRIDLAAGTGKCNCSFCTKARSWAALIGAEDFRLLEGEDALSDYQFGARQTHHHFCSDCGIRPFSRVVTSEPNGTFYAINLLCLDDLDPTELAEAPVQYVDGRNEIWDSSPDEVRHL